MLLSEKLGTDDAEAIRDLLSWAGMNVKKTSSNVKKEGFWMVAERKGKVAGGLTVTCYEKDPGFG